MTILLHEAVLTKTTKTVLKSVKLTRIKTLLGNQPMITLTAFDCLFGGWVGGGEDAPKTKINSFYLAQVDICLVTAAEK